MNKTAWTVIIIIVVIVILYLVYNYTFKKKVVANGEIPKAPLFNGLTPYEHHAQQTQNLQSLNSDPTANTNITNTDYKGYKESLNAVLALLGYKITNNGNTRVASATGKTLEKVQLKYAGNKLIKLEGDWYVDSAKWDLFDKLGLLKVTYDSSKDEQAYIVYNKFIEYFGQYFFNISAQKTASEIQQAAKNAIPTVDCNSQTYKDGLMRIVANFKDAKSKYQIAVFNINNVDNAENTQELNRSGKKLTEIQSEYNEYTKPCLTS